MRKTSPLKPNKVLEAWLNKATAAQKKALAKAAKTSVAVIQHYGKGRRQVSPEFAQRLAHAEPALKQIELCGVCRRCPIRKR